MKLNVTSSRRALLPQDVKMGISMTKKGSGGSGSGGGCVVCFEEFSVGGTVTVETETVPVFQLTLNFDPTADWDAQISAQGEFCDMNLTWEVEHHYINTEPPTTIINGGSLQVIGGESHAKGMTFAQMYAEGEGCRFPLGPRILIKDVNISEKCQFCFGGWETTGDLNTPTDVPDQPGLQFCTHEATGPWTGAVIADLTVCDFDYDWHYIHTGTSDPTVTEDLDPQGRPRLNFTGEDAELNGSTFVWITVRRNEMFVYGNPLCEFQVGPRLNVTPTDTCSSEFTGEVWYPQDTFFENFADFFAFGDYDIQIPVPGSLDTSIVEYYLPVTDADAVCIDTPGRMSASIEQTGGFTSTMEVFFSADYCDSGIQPAIKMQIVITGGPTPAAGDTWQISVYYDHPTLGPTLLGGDSVGAQTF